MKKDPGQLQALEQVLACFKTLRTTLQKSHIHLVIPSLCKLMVQLQESGILTVTHQIVVVRTLRLMCSGTKGILEETQAVVSRVVHCLVKVIATALSHNIPTSSQLYNECILGNSLNTTTS